MTPGRAEEFSWVGSGRLIATAALATTTTTTTAASITTATTATTAATTTAATATTASTIAAATTTAAAAPASTAITAAAATAGRTILTRARFVHGQGATVKGVAVKHGDGLLRVFIRRHGDEGEAAGFAGEFVLHKHDFGDRASLREVVLEIGLGRVERQVADVEFITHLV